MTQPITVSLRRESDDPLLNRDVLAVCRDVVQVCADVVAVDPPMGCKPFIVQEAPDGIPRACLNGLPNEYLINVTCLHTRLYAKLAFQLGHELGHFFVHPHYSNLFIEAVCTAISFLGLDKLANKWTTAPPFPNWREYAPSFSEYRQKTVGDAVAKVGISDVHLIPTWIRRSLASIVDAGCFDRPEEMLCAETIASIMQAHGSHCSAVTRLGAASKPDGKTDIVSWRSSVSVAEAELVDDLAETFAYGFQRPEEPNKRDAGDA